MSLRIKRKIKKIYLNNKNNKKKNNNSKNSKSFSIFEGINNPPLFHPDDKYINYGEKTCYNLMTYDLDIFGNLAQICKQLNISYDKLYQDYHSSNKLNYDDDDNNNNENIINSSRIRDKKIARESIFKDLLSKTESENKETKQKKKGSKKLNNSKSSLDEEDIDELLKDYSSMEIDN